MCLYLFLLSCISEQVTTVFSFTCSLKTMASNKMSFMFNPDQYAYNSPTVYNQDDEQMFNDEDGDIDNHNHNNNIEELKRTDYLKEYELDYTPNIIRWIKSNYLQQIKGEQHTVLVSGYNHCNDNFLQIFNYGKSKNNQSIEVIADHTIKINSEIADIQFADDQTAIIVTINGQIQLIKLEQKNDEYSPKSSPQQHDNEDEKMMQSNQNDDALDHNKWNLNPILSQQNPIICYPDPNNKKYHGVLTSVAVSTIAGKIVASDENGCIYITDIDNPQAPTSQVLVPYNLSLPHVMFIYFFISQSCSSSVINCIGFANSDTIVSVSMSGQILLWDLRDLKKVVYATSLPRKYGSLMSLSVHPHRNHISATGTETGNVMTDIRNRSNNQQKSYKLFAGHCKDTVINDIKFIGNTVDHEINGLVTAENDGITQIFQSEQDGDGRNCHNQHEYKYHYNSRRKVSDFKS